MLTTRGFSLEEILCPASVINQLNRVLNIPAVINMQKIQFIDGFGPNFT